MSEVRFPQEELYRPLPVPFNSLEKHIIQGTLDGRRARGRPEVNWLNNITGWTGVGLQDILRTT